MLLPYRYQAPDATPVNRPVTASGGYSGYMPLKSRISSILATRRQQLGLSYRAAGERCGVSYATVRDIERANPEDNPTIGIIDQVLAGLGIDLQVAASADGAALEPEPVVAEFYRTLALLDERERRRLQRYLALLAADVQAESGRGLVGQAG
jgi:transcriptional regulator with XRE-family HTH domain